jgi:hypothetical protein
MSNMDFEQFFKTATGIETGPFEYQCRLACGEQPTADPLQPFNDSTVQPPQADWLRSGTECKSRLINIPTGLGNRRRRAGLAVEPRCSPISQLTVTAPPGLLPADVATE